ncbi:A/G-specific adenine glycosylase [Campylobacter sp. MIT 19-121]|uniref:A/G-specific adenine glycosylase n=1 Tax=Campylobacter sp. MIT 19-121 TaxID=2703906 RepID=UPI001389417B|nr:A/G-specific adenine glycosylase [Campylobacter sp. MIT 19-121]NDJ27183.1 A/G-specific adenine glycosylase [Campylobacter sp. MIT 19-121]
MKDKTSIIALQNKLLSWYEKHGRKTLPWRNLAKNKDEPHFDERLSGINRAYGVYISEIMLQQTQVSRVLSDFYFPFLAKFPSLKALARADESELLKAWQGLGYYSRARNLKACALQCEAEFKGVLPRKKDELLRLKGIGSYTAGAIACFAYDEAVSFVDGNIKRVLSRLFKLEQASLKELEELAERILNKNNPFDHNQALLDLGALICIPKAPKCGLCPLYELCEGKFEPLNYTKNKKTEYEKLNLHALFITYKDKIILEKSKTKLYKGLYNPILLETKPADALYLGSFKHSYTKYKLEVKVYHKRLKNKEKHKFIALKELDLLPLSNLCVKALKLLNQARLS